MAMNAIPLYFGQPGTTETPLYTVPPSTTTDIKEIWIANTTGSAATLTLGIIPPSGTASAANRLMVAKTIPANDIIIIAGWEPILAGSVVSALQGTASAITVRISGVEWS